MSQPREQLLRLIAAAVNIADIVEWLDGGFLCLDEPSERLAEQAASMLQVAPADLFLLRMGSQPTGPFGK